MANNIGEKIRKMRKAAGMSQQMLGNKIGVSYQQIQKYEKGASSLSVPRLIQISEAFGVPPESFLHGDDMGEKALNKSMESALSDDEMVALQYFRRLKNKNLRVAFLDILKSIVKIAEGK